MPLKALWMARKTSSARSSLFGRTTVRVALLFLVLVAVGQIRAAEPSDFAWARVNDADLWAGLVTSAVTATGLPESTPSDMSTFCPGYELDSRTDRTHFWVGLIAAIADAETRGRFNPRDSYTESFHEKGPDSPFVVSRGLLQLSFPGDRNNYGCEIPDAESLYDASVNLACGAKILTKLVLRDHRIAGQVGSAWQGGAAYWSTLRSKGGQGDSNARSLAAIVRDTQALSVCHARN
jgi:hypothetical protein